MNYSSILVTDLDGTLADSKQTISPRSLATLKELESYSVLRAIATGRNLFSARKVLSTHIPFDFLIFSGGVGILDWKSGDLLFSSQLSEGDTHDVIRFLQEEKRDFMIQAPLPENHLFQYWRGRTQNGDFQRRCEVYSPYCRPWSEENIPSASQIIVVEPAETGARFYDVIRSEFPNLSVVRTTSPLDNQSVWIEISHNGITKASAAEWLCRRFKIPSEKSVGIGNDYNDRDLLEWVKISFVVENSPDELKEKYQKVASNDAEGFSEAVARASALLHTR